MLPDEVIRMRRTMGWIVAGVAVALMVGVVVQASPLFDRAAFIERVRQAFKPLEALLPDGDAFDYEETAIFSGVVNGSQEHVVVVPLTQASLSFYVGEHLGEQLSWADIDTLPLFGFYMLPPTDCIHTLKPDTPYLVRGISWDQAEVVDANDTVVRLFMTWWRRGEKTPAYYKFLGNIEIHIQTCTTASSNQQ
jgi:hypothetical protein